LLSAIDLSEGGGGGEELKLMVVQLVVQERPAIFTTSYIFKKIKTHIFCSIPP
jgi:hypothetical protein